MLEARGLVAGYGAGLVLQGVDLGIEAGRTLALLGRNGMGKTTLLRTLMGLPPPRAGSVRFLGRELAGAPTHEIARAGIAYAPQGREIFGGFTVDENLRLGLIGRDGGEAALGPLFAWFPILAERRRQRAGSLSGGEQQMLCLARALAAGPKLLLLDEPTEGVQPSIVEEIGAALALVVRETGLAMLLVEQNIDLALTLADEVAFMTAGRIVERLPAAAVDDAVLARHLLL